MYSSVQNVITTMLGLESLPLWALVGVICVIIAGLTEVTSNMATANILLPVLAELARANKMNPLYLMIPAAVTCSYAFMLPVATPPNAIVHEASGDDEGNTIQLNIRGK